MNTDRESPQRILLTVREVAFVLGCGRTLVYDLISSRQLPVVKVGRLTRVPRAAVDTFVSRHLTTGSSIALQTPGAPASRRQKRPRAGVSVDTAQTALFEAGRG